MIVTFESPTVLEAAAGETRTIRGTAVPWGQVGTVSNGQRVKFLPGALSVDARPVVTLGHDGPGIGRVFENTSSETGMATAVRVSDVQTGRDALTLAADGVLAMFSVGVDPTEYTFDDDGVMVVAAADWRHLALLPDGAFADAVVSDVAASKPKEIPVSELVADPPAVDVAAAPPTPPNPPAVIPVAAARPAAPDLTFARIGQLVASANRGEISTEAVKATIAAALANVTSTNAAGVIQPAYRAQITAIVDHGAPIMNLLSSAPLPASGMAIEYPRWTTPPTTGPQGTEKTAIVSTPAVMGMSSAPVTTIAGGNDISLQAVERSSPSFLAAYLEAASLDWTRKASAAVISSITAGAVVATPGTDYLSNVQALLTALDPAVTPPGPLFVAMSYDVALPLISVTALNGPAFWEGKISFGDALPTVSGGGLIQVIDWNLAPSTMIAGSVNGATVHLSAGAPADIRVVDVSLLGLDVGVYGYLCTTVEYPSAFATLAVAP